MSRGKGSIAVKIAKVAHSIMVENGEDKLWGRRCETKGFVGDQAERGVPRGPFGDKDEINDVCTALLQGTMSHFNPRAKNICFMMNALTQPGIWHVLFNPLEKAWTSLPEFKQFDIELKAVVKVLGDKSYKELMLEVTFADATAVERHLVHKFSGTVVDFKWENREYIIGQVVDVFPILQKYYKPSHLVKEGALGQNVTAACKDDFLPGFLRGAVLGRSLGRTGSVVVRRVRVPRVHPHGGRNAT